MPRLRRSPTSGARSRPGIRAITKFACEGGTDQRRRRARAIAAFHLKGQLAPFARIYSDWGGRPMAQKSKSVVLALHYQNEVLHPDGKIRVGVAEGDTGRANLIRAAKT